MFFSLTGSTTMFTNISFFSSCVPAEEEPVVTNANDCQPLIKLKNPFCEYYGIKLDKYVDVEAKNQKENNDELWSYLEVYKWLNTSDTTECLSLFSFLICHELFPGCDHSTSVFLPKKVCNESCLNFMNHCSKPAKVWADMTGKESPECLSKFARSAGNIPECAFYARNLKSLKRQSAVVGK